MPGQSWMDTVQPDLAARVREMADARGWLPPWPRWWGDEALAGLIPDPGARRHFAAGCPRLPRWPTEIVPLILATENRLHTIKASLVATLG